MGKNGLKTLGRDHKMMKENANFLFFFFFVLYDNIYCKTMLIEFFEKNRKSRCIFRNQQGGFLKWREQEFLQGPVISSIITFSLQNKHSQCEPKN